MSLKNIMEIKPIGIIHSPHKQAGGTPVQSSMSAGVEGTVEVFPEYAAGLKDLEGFERVWLVYWFDRAKTAQLVVVPYLDTVPRGLFATRLPAVRIPLESRLSGCSELMAAVCGWPM